MTNTTYLPQRPLSIGEVLDLTFRIYRATVLRCLLFAAAAVVLSQGPNIYSLLGGRGLLTGKSMLTQFRDPMFWLVYLVSLALVLALHIAVMRRQHALVTGQPTGGEVGIGLRRAPLMFLLYVLIGLACGVCVAFALLVPGAGRVLALVLVLVPVSYVIVASSVAWVALIVAGLGPVASLRRSWHLTAGSFWRLTAIYTVGMIVLLVVYFLVATVAAFLAGMIGHGDVAVVAAATSVIVVAVGALVTPFYTAMGLAVFGDLTVRRDGADLEQRISATA